MPYLLHQDPMALLAPTNHPRIKCKKNQINYSFELILHEDLPYSIAVKYIIAVGTRTMFKAFAMLFMCFFYIYIVIYSARSIRKRLKQHFY